MKKLNKFPKGKIKMPPSKSLSHRAVICGGLAQGLSRIDNVSLSEDITATVSCMEKLGMNYLSGNSSLEIRGGLTKGTRANLDCRESGSTLRFLIPIAAGLSGEVFLTGSKKLLERPLDVYFDIFRNSSAKLEKTCDGIKVSGNLTGGDYRIDGSVSSQFITGMLLALPTLDMDSRLIITTPLQSKSYVDMTIDVMKKFGVHVENDGYKEIFVGGGQAYKPTGYAVEGDFSQAAFYLVAAAISQNRGIECAGLNPDSLQGDKAILDILKRCGAEIIFENDVVKVEAKSLTAIEVDASDIPDLVPPLAVLLSFCQGKSRIYNAGRLRIKESDRLAAVTTEMNRVGAKIIEGDDFLEIEGVEYLTGGNADSWNDHRIAMAMAVAALRSKETIYLAGASSVNKSYPCFWDDFEVME